MTAPLSRVFPLASSSLLVLAACAPVSGPVAVEALVRDASAEHGHRLATVELVEVQDLFTGKGRLFDVRSGMSTSFDRLFLVGLEAQDPSAPLTSVEVAERMRGTAGGPANPRLSYDVVGERWVADDFESLVYLTTLYNFEQAWTYYRDVVGDTSGATKNHGYVGLSAAFILSEWLPLEIPFLSPPHDNAGYNSATDSFLLVPHLYAEAVPISASQGVIAHELGHRVFQYNVVFEHDVSFFASAENLLDAYVLSGLNEGMADLFAVGMMRDPDFFRASLAAGENHHGGMHALADDRHLDGPLADAMTWESLTRGEHPESCGDALPPPGMAEADEDAPAFNFYCLGTLAARALWDAAGKDVEVLRTEVAPAVLRGLHLLGARIAEGTGDQEELAFDVTDYLDAMATVLPPARRGAYCAVIADRFSPLLTPAAVPACF